MTVSTSAAPFKAIKLLSVDELTPTEEGGPIARIGFSYQDEIAIGFCLDMLAEPSLIKIQCESHDDLVLIRSVNDARVAEFVQVKAGEPEKLWSVADLCRREGSALGTSIFETSLARDRCSEKSLFRLVTSRPVVNALKPLTYPLGAPGRESVDKTLVDLLTGIEKSCPNAKSDKGNASAFWVANCVWDVRHDQTSVERANLLKVLRLSALEQRDLLPEQAEILLTELREKVKVAGLARWKPDRDRKVITRDSIREWWTVRTANIRDGAISTGGGKLAVKLIEVGAGAETVALALDIRRDYAATIRARGYMVDEASEALQTRVKAEMMSLRARFSAGYFDITGAVFLAKCLVRLDEINASLPANEVDRLAFLQGCMYDIADRCLHRFSGPFS